MLELRQALGNQQMARLLSNHAAGPQPQSTHHGLLLQRKCACGAPASSPDEECAECKSKKHLQAKLTLGASNDPLEQEADRVADQVMTTPEHSPAGGASPRIQRYTGQAAGDTDTVPASVDRALAGPGRPLEPVLQQDMEQRFGHDFSRVRVHSGDAAERSAQDVDAKAYTVGNDIVFGEAQLTPGTDSGRRLLAHELTHVVQQSTQASSGQNGAAPVLRAAPKQKAAPKKKTPKVLQICGRPSRKVAGNFITKVNIDVGANALTIEWDDKTKIPPRSAGPHDISPGSGLCCVDCNDAKISQTSGSLCTPKGGTWPVDHTGCVLSGHPTAKNPTYFQRESIAIHSGNTSSPPRSHGCSRTSVEISELIHDNVVPGTTQIASSGAWAGTQCYLTEATDKLSNRKDVCDGNKLKSKTKDKKTEDKKAKDQPKQRNRVDAPAEVPAEVPTKQPPKPAPPPVPVAEALPGESDELTAELAPVADGPGPNNEPPSHESLDEMSVADLDLTEETEETGDTEAGTAAV